jgi:hypothetical protein
MADFFETLFNQVAIVLAPVQEATQSDWGMNALLGPIGFDLDVVPGLDLAPLQAAMADLVSAVQDLQGATGPQAISDVASALEAVASAISGAQQLMSGLASQPSLPAGLASAFSAAGEGLVQSLIANWVGQRQPVTTGLLDLLGAFADVPASGSPVVTTSGAIAYLPVSPGRVSVQTLLAIFRDPAGTLSTQIFGGPASALTGEARVAALAAVLWPRLQTLGFALGRGVVLGADPGYLALTGDLGAAGDQLANAAITFPIISDGTGDQVMLGLTLVPAAATGDRTSVVLTIAGEASQTITAGSWQISIGAAGAVQALAVDTAGNVTLPATNAATDTLTLTAAVSYAPASASAAMAAATTTTTPAAGGGSQPPALLIGAANGSRLEINQITLTGTASFGTQGAATVGADVTFGSATIVVDFSEGDGFLQQIAGTILGSPIQASADVTIGWAGDRGVYLEAGGSVDGAGPGGLTAQLATNLDLGPIRIPSITVGVAPSNTSGDEQLGLALGLNAAVSIGPVSATVTGVGLSALLDGQPGNLGALDLTLGFKPPDGVALAIDADPVSGGGFVAFDPVHARYLGALALAVGDVSIEAVGVLDTILPGGASGYSLVILAAVDFPPVQLGFGFSLVGIGGLVGVNRTVNVPALQALARAGQLDSLMFPIDLADRAPQVAASLAQVFPPAQGHFIIGPALRIEWGTAGILDVEVGVFIELSDSGGGVSLLRVAVLGWVHMTLPDSVEPVADVTLDVLGVVDIPGQTLSLDAGLRNSTIAGFTLTGQAALRAGWGANPSFVLAVGGFNPHFAAPAGFPALQRIALSLGGSDPRLRLSAYFALTSNTVQFGCAADLYASAGPAAVSASLTFDALVQIQPFGLIVDLTINANVLLGGSPVLSLSLDLHVTGPQPWVVTGSASFQVLCFSYTVPISITVGPQPPPAAPQTVDLDTNLTTALVDPRSWQTGPPSGRGVVIVSSQPGAGQAIHPLGTLTVRQSAVPLEQLIECYGPDLLASPCTYQITAATLGGLSAPGTDVTDFFAPAQFLTMTDAQKLSAPSFQPMTAGTMLGSPQLTLPATPGSAGAAATVADTVSTLTWDVLMLDSPNPASTSASPAAIVPSSTSATLPATLLAAQLPGAAASVNGAAGRGPARYAGPGSGIAVEQPSYAVVGMNLTAIGTSPTISMGIPSVVAALGTQPDGVTGAQGQEWQVVYTSEVPG